VGSGAKSQPTNDLVHIGVKSVALVPAVFVMHMCKRVDGIDLELRNK